ncbi:MAG: hypothetical protein JWN33_591 [Candidatus Saccharibacteria bacterium]|nr:hypothetical protein [Candidatus Saccharibacteria bacterium]
MVQKKANSTKTPAKKPVSRLKTGRGGLVAEGAVWHDFKVAVLVVSVAFNLFILIGWLILQITRTYDSQVASFLFGQ